MDVTIFPDVDKIITLVPRSPNVNILAFHSPFAPTILFGIITVDSPSKNFQPEYLYYRTANLLKWFKFSVNSMDSNFLINNSEFLFEIYVSYFLSGVCI